MLAGCRSIKVSPQLRRASAGRPRQLMRVWTLGLDDGLKASLRYGGLLAVLGVRRHRPCSHNRDMALSYHLKDQDL